VARLAEWLVWPTRTVAHRLRTHSDSVLSFSAVVLSATSRSIQTKSQRIKTRSNTVVRLSIILHRERMSGLHVSVKPNGERKSRVYLINILCSISLCTRQLDAYNISDVTQRHSPQSTAPQSNHHFSPTMQTVDLPRISLTSHLHSCLNPPLS
jgi:hypothetical protein